jgi:UDP-N-acetylglucosamine 3-dehydrogenase
MAYTYAVIGCGKPWKSEGATGFGMSHQHARGFLAAGCTLVALADIVEENAAAFRDKHGGAATKLYTDYHRMLAEVKPDIVSVCTWPKLHTEMVLAALDAGARAVHCEKPMALTFGEARAMHRRAMETGALLTFNHQRRFNAPFQRARQLLRDNIIGRPTRLDVICGNLYDWGTHWFDMMFFLNDETPADWVIGQIDLRDRKEIFGAPLEGQGLSHIKLRNDLRATIVTGHQLPAQAQFTLHGTEGTLEIEPPNCGNNHVRYRTAATGGQWHNESLDDTIHGDQAHARACQDLVACLTTRREPELSSRKALAATELIFATYESSRRRGRIDLPLTIDDSPLADLIAKAG